MYGAETYWELRDDQGKVLESGGNTDVGPDGGGKLTGIPGGPGAYNNNTTVRDTLNLPGPGCYSIHFVDYYGDGMCCDYGSGYYKLYNLDDLSVPILSGGEFRAYDDRSFSAGLATSTHNPGPGSSPSLVLYPNPASTSLQANFILPEPATVSIAITNAMGQIVYKTVWGVLSSGEQYKEMDTSRLPEGVYWFRLQANDQIITRRFIVHRF